MSDLAAFRKSSLLCLAYITLLTGCGDGGEQELRKWMDGVRRETRMAIPKLSEPKTFKPFMYGEKGAVDPFNPQKLQVALAKQQSAGSNAFRPNLERRREPLEMHPLDSMKMVGTMNTRATKLAVIEIGKLIYQVKVGSYMGQNFGMVAKITDGSIELKEVVQDPGGEWVERKATLELQEAKK